MKDDDPLFLRILDKLGVNTTRLRWKLYKNEEKIKSIAKHGVRPTRFQWLWYPHKICSSCEAINDRDERICHACDTKLPSIWGYRIHRLVTSTASSDRPLVTQLFMGLMLFFFAFQISAGGFSMGNIMLVDFETTLKLGTFNTLIYQGPEHWFRWMAFAFLHGDLIHIAFNLYALYNICPIIEAHIGRVRMLVLITLTQLGSAFACYFWYYEYNETYWVSVVGASGWLFGIIGFAIATFHRSGQIGIRNQLLKWSFICLAFGFLVGGISNTGHVGGLISGIAIALFPLGGNLRKPWIEKTWAMAGGISLLLWVLTIGAMLYSLFFMDYSFLTEN